MEMFVYTTGLSTYILGGDSSENVVSLRAQGFHLSKKQERSETDAVSGAVRGFEGFHYSTFSFFYFSTRIHSNMLHNDHVSVCHTLHELFGLT